MHELSQPYTLKLHCPIKSLARKVMESLPQ